jgi:hypothetical protein
MSGSDKDASYRIQNHIHFLSESIGPRGSTTPEERLGAEYCRDQFKHIGLTPVWEEYLSAKSIFTPHLIGSALFLASFLIYPLAGPVSAWIAALVSLTALTSELLELGFQPNLFRWIAPKAKSQNVYTTIAPKGEHRRDIILIGHVDTQHTPLIFKNKQWVDLYKQFTTIAFILFSIQVLLSFIGAIFQSSWIWYAQIPSVICAVLLGAICVQANSTPFTRGANDNASAVGMVLELAHQFSQSRLEHTRLYCVVTGCEEVQHYGAIDFFNRHRKEMKDPIGIVFELVGCEGPAWCTREGIIIPFTANPSLVKLAERVSARHPEWQAYLTTIKGGNSEMSDCIRNNVPAITLFGLDRQGEAPYWHQPEDTYDKIKPEIVEAFYTLAKEMIQEIDRQ